MCILIPGQLQSAGKPPSSSHLFLWRTLENQINKLYNYYAENLNQLSHLFITCIVLSAEDRFHKVLKRVYVNCIHMGHPIKCSLCKYLCFIAHSNYFRISSNFVSLIDQEFILDSAKAVKNARESSSCSYYALLNCTLAISTHTITAIKTTREKKKKKEPSWFHPDFSFQI